MMIYDKFKGSNYNCKRKARFPEWLKVVQLAHESHQKILNAKVKLVNLDGSFFITKYRS